MSKKDYEAVAAAISRSRMASKIIGTTAVKAAKAQAIRLVAIDLAATFRADNPRFDRDRFLKAAGVSE